jgi:amino acid adenylation domain-containing protein/non-ribosomal peptide synthase protein (TIGR01720 family)
LLRGTASLSGDAVTAQTKNVEAVYPLTPLQQGMLFHALLDTGDAYFQQVVWDVTGALDVVAFEAAWTFVIRRHEVLRTVFGHLGTDRPLQVVLRELPVAARVVDLAAAAGQEAAVERLIAQDRSRPFDLARGPLMRLTLVRRGEDFWTAIWSHHHILLDGWSVGVVLSDWVAAYAALRRHRTPQLAPASPWSRYVSWLDRRDTAPSENYWTSYVAGFEAATPLPALATPVADDDGRRLDLGFDLGAKLTASLARWAARRNATVGAALHALWAILLARHCGTEDVLFGTVVSGRAPEIGGIEGMVGNFANTVPVRLTVAPAMTIAGLLAAAQRDLLAGAPHQLFPLARIQAASPLRGALIGSLIACENYPLDRRLLDDGGAASLGFAVTGARTVERTHYPLAAQFLPGDSFRLRVICRPDLHSAEQITGMAGHLTRILATAIDNDEQKIGAIDILSLQERIALVAHPWVDAEPAPATVLPLIAQHARLKPDAAAVSGAAHQLSYGALDRLSDVLARELGARHGVARDDRVALIADRDAPAILGMIATLKAGGAYVPLDPKHPPARLAELIRQAGCRVVLADAAHAALARGIAPGAVIEIMQASRAAPDTAPLSLPCGGDLAYVIHTSGSTGIPKAVAIEHRALANLVGGLHEAIYQELAGPLRIALIASFAFDASVKQIFAALCGGHTLVIADAATRRDPQALAAFLAAQGIAVCDATPTLAAAVVAAGGAPALRQLRHLLIGGEPLPPALVTALLEGNGGLALSNVYGPTECCVDATAQRCAAGAPGPVPIGRALRNQRVYLLDEMLRPVPLGAPGEIFLGGRGLARGYLGRPDLTAERFLPDPFMPGARVYRTGDRGRRRGDGSLEFLGRFDDQIKLRGHRIEPGEIEARLNAHPAIAAAAVLADAQGNGLVACVVPAGAPPSVQMLRRDLAAALPDFMLPSRFVMMSALPLTASGKVDRRRLRQEAATLPALPSGTSQAPPRNEIERLLAKLFGELTGAAAVGIDDNYFALGGDSIKAITLVSRLQRTGLRLALRDLFAHPTIAELAPCLTRAEAAPRPARAATAPLTPIAARRLAGTMVPPARFNQTILLRAAERLDVPVLRRALAHVVAHHEGLRLAIELAPGGWRQRAAEAGEPALDLVDLGGADPAATIAAHAGRLQGTLDPSAGRLVTGAVYRGDDGDRLLLAVHHFGIDAVSWRILLEDLTAACRALQAGAPVTLPETTGFVSWAAALAAHASEIAAEGERAHWTAVAAADVPPFPADDFSAPDREADAGELALDLDPAASATLSGAGNSLYRTTPEDLLATALLRALERWGGLRRLRLGREGHGRGLALPGLDISRSIGWFTTVHPALIELPARDISYQIRAVKEQLRAVPQDGFGYGLLRWPPNGGAGIADAAMPVLLNYLGQVDAPLTAAGLRFDMTPTGSAVDSSLPRHHEIELSAAVINGRLRLGLRHGRRHARATAERLLAAWAGEVLAVARHLTTSAVAQMTPSDLSFSGLTLDELESIVS